MPARVTVVVPVYNGELTLADCLRALGTQTLSKSDYQIIVVIDRATTDSSAEVAKQFDVQLILEGGHGAGTARNAGIAASTTKWVAFTDDDCIPTRAWLSYLLQALSDGSDVGAIGAAGRTVGFESFSPAARYVDLTGGLDAATYLRHPNFPFAPAVNLIYLRDSLNAVGGYDKRYYSQETVDLHYRLVKTLGGRLLYEPRALVLHRHRASWKAYWQQQFNYGRGLAQFMLHHRDASEWSRWRELESWARLVDLGIRACVPGSSDRVLVRRGTFVKQLAQRMGFVTTYWNSTEQKRWLP
jgi:glycosyltransferase involved in cell wall biosynthesis